MIIFTKKITFHFLLIIPKSNNLNEKQVVPMLQIFFSVTFFRRIYFIAGNLFLQNILWNLTQKWHTTFILKPRKFQYFIWHCPDCPVLHHLKKLTQFLIMHFFFSWWLLMINLLKNVTLLKMQNATSNFNSYC